LILTLLIFFLSIPAFGHAQERRKIRISNATLSYSALQLVAAREWKLFQKQGLDVEIILMRRWRPWQRWSLAILTISRVSDPRA
jgi:ABC-type nitrate/sulfonate/bicarbonate transport system substrate-binding protein